MFIDLASADPLRYFSIVGFALLSICIHESCHARMAVKFGDLTPKDYISINPVKQMGWVSMGLLALVGIAWGRVPVDPRGCGSRERNALVYLVGPLSNLALCAVFALLSQTAQLWEAPIAGAAFRYGSEINGVLFLLNLLPVPPLDGFGVLRSLVTQDIAVQQNLNQLAGIGLMMIWLTPIGSYLALYGHKLADFFLWMWLAPFS